MPSGSDFIAAFISQRPRLYHLTAKRNADLVVSAGVLHPAAHILRESGESRTIREKRPAHLEVEIGSSIIHLRDQQPLHAGNLALSDGWTFADFVEHLNEHVFFWPGTAAGPSDYGRRHFQRYADEPNAVLVLDSGRLIAANSKIGVRFCRYNSGSPRCNGGKPSPRGKETFRLPGQFEGGPGSVVEVTFRGSITLTNALIAVHTPARYAAS